MKQIIGVKEEILECAKKEFLQKGFNNSSLRKIAKQANTSTGSIYTRFGDKKGLFNAIVEPYKTELKNIFNEVLLNNNKGNMDDKEFMIKSGNLMLDFIYAHFDEFRLLIECTNGEDYQKFIDDLVEIETVHTNIYLKQTGIKHKFDDKKLFLHIVFTSFINGLFEVVKHRMNIDEAKYYFYLLSVYNWGGFSSIIKLQ